MKGIFGGCGVELQNRGGVEDEQAGAVFVEAQVKAVGLLIFGGLHVMWDSGIESFGEGEVDVTPISCMRPDPN